MKVYLDTSVLLRVLLRQRGALRDLGRFEAAFSSTILRVEARRVIDRLRLEGALDDEGVAGAHGDLAYVEEAIGFVELTPAVLDRAGQPMPTVLRTLDALHMASALLLREGRGEPVTFATHDTQQRRAATALGFPCLP